MQPSFPRRTFLKTLAAGAVAASLATPALADDAGRVLRFGYQKYGTAVILKSRGTLEKRLKALGVEVKWIEFPAGPQLLEGLNVGSIDFGTTGEAPPVFAQASGAPLVYVGNEPPSPLSEAIVVPKDSPIRSVQELKGKRIVLNKGSNVHYLLVKALEKAGLQYSDVQTVFLPPADARAAFERGSVDAWVIWDPFLAAAEKQLGARIVQDGRGLVSNHQFYLAARGYAEKQREVVKVTLDELDRTDRWAQANQKDAAAQLSPLLGLAPEVVELAVTRYAYGVAPISDKVAAEQQKIADAFANLKLIPKPVRIADALVN